MKKKGRKNGEKRNKRESNGEDARGVKEGEGEGKRKEKKERKE